MASASSFVGKGRGGSSSSLLSFANGDDVLAFNQLQHSGQCCQLFLFENDWNCQKKLFTFENALYAIQMGKENIGIIGNTDSGDKMKRRIDDIKEASENVVAGVPDEKILRPLLVSYLAPAPGDRWKRSSVSENDILNPTDEIGTLGNVLQDFDISTYLKVVQQIIHNIFMTHKHGKNDNNLLIWKMKKQADIAQMHKNPI